MASRSSKVINGIIREWELRNNRITGKIVQISMSVRVTGDHLTTSEIVEIRRIDNGQTVIAETQNSLYILL